MNPVTFNNRFVRALKEHPDRAYLEQFFGKWQVAPLFDYETTFDKELALTPQGIGLDDMQHMPWPFETFRLSLVERDVPSDAKNPDAEKHTYKTHLVARRDFGQLQLLIFWRSFAANPGCPCRSRRPETVKQHNERAEKERNRYKPSQTRPRTKGE